MNRAFVFVVCGPREHIETLNTSLAYLSRFARHEILVVTDSARNEAAIQHDRIVDVTTPATLTHHQASIYLKTGLARWLPSGRTYCYLDSDVLAVDARVNDVFDQPRETVAFAQDHCQLDRFSPYAVRCDCLKRHDRRHAEFERLMAALDTKQAVLKDRLRAWREKRRQVDQPRLRPRTIALRRLIRQWRNNQRGVGPPESPAFPWHRMHFWLRGFHYDRSTREWRDLLGHCLLRDFSHFFQEQGFRFDPTTRIWCDLAGNFVMGEAGSEHMASLGGRFHYDARREDWVAEDGTSMLEPANCGHLAEKIEQDFGVHIHDRTWRHWNGGVFVFDDRSHAFLDYWHAASRNIFGAPDWRTRDQGTLVASAWKFGLQNSPTLPIKFNFIADYNSAHLAVDAERGLRIRDGSYLQPYFVHVYHEFGRRDWDVWQWLASRVASDQDRVADPPTLATTL